jgi:hypothetical protein
MGKTWIVCIDGTWHDPGHQDNPPDRDTLHEQEKAAPSNVVKAWYAVARVPLPTDFHYGAIAPLAPQSGFDRADGEIIYLTGIGTTGTIRRMLEGATGTGTSERIRDAYRFLAQRYTEGDRIFCFGFSRGAYAIRSLAGLIDFAGLPRRPRALKEEEVLAIYDAYRTGARVLDRARHGMRKVTVDFLGMWDTVGRLAFGETFNAYHRVSPTNVGRVAHALALDEVRKPFTPNFWDRAPAAATRVDEIWFAGAHANVGGGYADAELSNIALFWVLKAAREQGLPLDLPSLPDYNRADPCGLRDAYRESCEYLPFVGQVVARFNLERRPRSLCAGQRVHRSVFQLMSAKGPPHTPYEPAARFEGALLSPEYPSIEEWGFETAACRETVP